MKQLLQIMVVCIIVVVCMQECDASRSSPIVIVPGLMGSRLEVKDSNSVCSTKNLYRNLWVAPYRLTRHKACAKKELSLEYNAATDSFSNSTNVDMIVPDFGGTKAIEYLRVGIINLGAYFHTMVNYFVDKGYKRGVSIRGAPYDWRLAADELERLGYFHRLKDLVEDSYYKNGNTKVTIVAHSMGGPVSLYFFTKFDGINQRWKDKFIHAYIPIAGAWNGAVTSLEAVISGTSISFLPSFINKYLNKILVPIVRTLESFPWLTPTSSVFGNEVIVSTLSDKEQYTPNDYEKLFRDIGYTNGYRFFQRVQPLLKTYPQPNVKTFCFYGDDLPTPIRLRFTKTLLARIVRSE